MNLLIVAATRLEIQPLINYLELHQNTVSQNDVRYLITGIGSLVSAYHLTTYLSAHQPACCIQAGLAGTFTSELSPGQLVLTREEVLGDLGAEEANGFDDVFDLALQKESEYPFTGKKLINPNMQTWDWLKLPVVTGVTVNEISTRNDRIALLENKYNCQVETMEGAAFHYVCLQKKIPFVQIRAVSNYVGDRDRRNWKFKESLENLNDALIKIISSNIHQ